MRVMSCVDATMNNSAVAAMNNSAVAAMDDSAVAAPMHAAAPPVDTATMRANVHNLCAGFAGHHGGNGKSYGDTSGL